MKNELTVTGLIKPSNLAKKLGVSRQYIYQLIKANKIDSRKIDSVLFVELTEKTYSKLLWCKVEIY